MTHVLIIEDEPDLRAMVTLLLGIAGFDTVEAADGEEGLALFDPDGVTLLDIRMPGISGIEVMQRIPPQHRARVLFMSAHADLVEKDLQDEYGCAGFLVKPFALDDLVTRVTELSGAVPVSSP